MRCARRPRAEAVPRDYDEKGQRIPCPRFNGVTCGEHIRIEPGIFEKFCDGSRVSPRHIMVELDGKETYDVYYTNDTASVFTPVRKGAEFQYKVAIVPSPEAASLRADSRGG